MRFMSPIRQSDSEPETPVVLSGSSPIQVKFIGWLVLILAGGFSGCIWWAATMSTKLDVVIANQSTQIATTKAMAEDLALLKEWRVRIDTVGSPEMVKRTEALRKDLDELRTKFDLHLATTMQKTP